LVQRRRIVEPTCLMIDDGALQARQIIGIGIQC
jgi:hypothetical protein